jgi:hypothetical protein
MRALGIDAVAEYDVYARLDASRLTLAGDAAMPADTKRVWLGGLHDVKTRIAVDR